METVTQDEKEEQTIPRHSSTDGDFFVHPRNLT